MGIPGFNTWFSSAHSRAYVPLKTAKIDHLYIDMNSVLHLVLRKARNMGHFHSLLYIKLDAIVNASKPQKSVLFALDGPAPLAKLLTQRARRKKAVLTEAMKKGKVISSLAITPGTAFMAEVHDSLAYYICQRLMNKKFSHLHYELSGSTVQGEGEVKILSRLQRPLEHMAPEDSHAIVGNDSDLILMGLLTDAPSLYVFGQILLQDPPPTEKMKVLSVESLHKIWRNLGPPAEEDPEAELQRLRGMKQDLALTCIMGKGNDYLPSVPGVALQRYDSIGDGDGLWETYLRLRKEPRFRKRALAKQGPDGFSVLDEDFLMHLLETTATPVKDRVVTPNLKPPEPDEYLEGICWILDMYRGGVCPDYRFCYDGLGPTAEELCEAIKRRRKLPAHEKKRLQSRAQVDASQVTTPEHQQPGDQAVTRLQPLKPAVCAMAMLPKSGQNVAPVALRHLMNENSAIHDMYRDCEECEWYSTETSSQHFQLAGISRQKLLLNEKSYRLDKAKEKDPALEKEIEKLDKTLAQLKEKIKDTAAKRQLHLEQVHPYKPFAIHRIEQAVGQVPLAQYPEKEKQLTKFGREYIYRRAPSRSAGNAEASRTVSGRGKSKKGDTQRLTKPPEPPASKFTALRGPLPILRLLRSPVEPHQAFTRITRTFVNLAKGKL